MARLIEAGEDPRFVARRLVILASEDVGMADPHVARHRDGGGPGGRVRRAAGGGLEPRPGGGPPRAGPEVEPLRAGWWAAQADVRERPLGPVPAELRDAHYRGAAALGHGVGYEYPHDDPRGFVEAVYLPEGLAGRRYYEPSEHGAEKRLAEAWRARRGESDPPRGNNVPQGKKSHNPRRKGQRGARREVNADELRNTFTQFFVERGHLALPAASLVPNDPSMLFTIAGMVQFKPYFLAESPPPGPRATTVQPCVRTVDIDVIGTTSRHVTFFEMLGNFSFGDYFKDLAIAYAWELFTEGLGLDPEQLWVTVHVSDDEAEAIWREIPGLLPGRLQRLDEDNFWKMGETGPCGPCSEIFFDRGAQYGPGGGPAEGGERYVELWNLVFMQYDRHADGSLRELPQKNIDTGAGLDRILTQIQGVESVFDTDLVAPILEAASAATGPGLRRAARRPTSACASSPTTPAP